ncbi:MAG TPA: glycosyltransferase family 39 protein [Anaerolineae bacterium]|nr:glycosyltransferase family 39 protein [Anaerolineae bacterium]
MSKPSSVSKVLSDSRTRNLLLVLTLLLSAGLRLWALDAHCLWNDEVATWVHASAGGVAEVLSSVLRKELPAPPLHFLLTHFVLLLGDTDFTLRFPSVALGVLAVAATYSLGTQLFGREIGLSAALLLAISPFHIRYSQEARAYAQLTLLSVLSLYCLWRSISDSRPRWWFGFVTFATLSLYTHLFALLFLLAEIMFGVGLGLWAASRPEELPEARRKAASFATSLLAIATLYAPLVPFLLQAMGRQAGLASVGKGMPITSAFVVSMLGSFGSGPGLDLMAFLMLFLFGIIASVRLHRRQLWLTFCWTVVPFLALWVMQAKHGVHPRYMIFILPVYLVLVSRGLTALGSAASARLPRGWQHGRSFAFALLISVLAAMSLGRAWSYYAEDRADWRAAAIFLGTTIAPGEEIASPGALAGVLLPRYDERLEDVKFSGGGSEVFLDSTLRQTAGVWFVARSGRNMEIVEQALKTGSFSVFKVVFPVDRRSAETAIALDVGPMFYDLSVLYVRDGLEHEELEARYLQALSLVPPRAAASIDSALGELQREER